MIIRYLDPWGKHEAEFPVRADGCPDDPRCCSRPFGSGTS